MSLTRQIEAARVARERQGERIRAQMRALEAVDDALVSEGRLDVEIAIYLRSREILPTLGDVQQRVLHARECHENLMVLGLPLLRRLAQHAIDAHCAARAAGERSAYNREDLEKYLDPSRHHLINEFRILADRLLPSEALTVLLSLLPPENE